MRNGVLTPKKRHAPSLTGGTAGSCTDVLSEDLTAKIASGADPALFAGSRLWVQAWWRDPNDPFGDNLSDAITAVICP
jgi:hypothetical protein